MLIVAKNGDALFIQISIYTVEKHPFCFYPLGSPIQNSKTDSNGIHKPYTVKIQFLCHGLPGKSGIRNNRPRGTRPDGANELTASWRE